MYITNGNSDKIGETPAGTVHSKVRTASAVLREICKLVIKYNTVSFIQFLPFVTSIKCHNIRRWSLKVMTNSMKGMELRT